MSALDPTGTYCMMSGHAWFDCPGEGEFHIELMRRGFGISYVPGPTDAELREETEADTELMASEFHGRDTSGRIAW